MFVLTEEQESIRKTARELVQAKLPVAALRALRDEDDGTGFSRDTWRELAGLGLVGITLPESVGGAGLGYAELGLVLEECGRTLAATPYFSTVMLAANALLLGGTDAQKAEYLPPLCAGERILTLALDEGTRHARYRIETTAEEVTGGFRLMGAKGMVPDGHVADAFVVAARTSGAPSDRDGITLFLLQAGTDGLAVSRTRLVDNRNMARLRCAGILAPPTTIIGEVGRGADVLDVVLDRATVALSAEMLGSTREVFERTVAYLKDRRQFGVPIGSFQALKHRAAHLFCEVELTQSIVMDALRAIDDGRADLPIVASAAKARATDTFLAVANEAVQMHGGVGVTDELDIGFFLKRARVTEMLLGNSADHRDRFARLQGY